MAAALLGRAQQGQEGHPRRPTTQSSLSQLPRCHAATLPHRAHPAQPSNDDSFLFPPYSILRDVLNSDLMRPGVRLPTQSSSLARENAAPPTSGPAKKHIPFSGWLRKPTSRPEHIIHILGSGHPDNPESPLELEDLAKAPRNPPGTEGASSRAAKRGDKRLRKLEWLAEQEDMKFSHSIQFNAVPDWSSNYISYSNLKKL